MASRIRVTSLIGIDAVPRSLLPIRALMLIKHQATFVVLYYPFRSQWGCLQRSNGLKFSFYSFVKLAGLGVCGRKRIDQLWLFAARQLDCLQRKPNRRRAVAR